MDNVEAGVVVGAVVLTAFVLWYFFGARESTAAAIDDRGTQHVRIVVKGGYSPDRISVKRGRPVQLDFYRDETSTCTEQVVLSDFGIVRDLPAFETTSIEFTPDRAGEFAFACGMNMVHGKLVVQE